MPEHELRRLLKEHGFTVANVSYAVFDEGRSFEYRVAIRTRRADNLRRLAWTLRDTPGIVEFQISATGDRQPSRERAP